MAFGPDKEVYRLMKKSGIRIMELANALCISYNSMQHRLGGYCQWGEGEREKIIKYIKKREVSHDANMREE